MLGLLRNIKTSTLEISDYFRLSNFTVKKYLIILSFALVAIASQAQNQPGVAKRRPVKKKKELYERVDQVAKINISSFAFRALSLQYEKKISRSKTMGIGLIYRPNFSTPFVNVLLKDTSFSVSAETMTMLKTARYQAWMISPELRFYVKKKAPRGLYLAPFLRHKRETFSADFRYQESGSGSSLIKTGLYKSKVNTLGLGVLFGLQILAKNKMTIDFWFLGPWVGYEWVKNTGKVNASGLNQYDKAYIESGTEGYNRLLGFSNQYSWSGSGFSSKSAGLTFGARIFGINVGYSF